MNIINTEFNDLYVMDYGSYHDDRGVFVKTIHAETFIKNNLEYNYTESFFSVSKKDVIRGMHFQLPPADHVKLVYVVTGSIIDVVLDIRKESKTYGSFFSIELSSKNRKGIYIGKGFAHGFLSLEDDTTVEYHTSTSQDRNLEGGIKYDSFGYKWNIENPIVSKRDTDFRPFSDIITSF